VHGESLKNTDFANLIADMVEHREPASTYVQKIKERFGVEE
jgi:hypothetical protein